MKSQFFVIDDFYDNPDSVRDFALSQEFSTYGNYPGVRTQCAGDEHREYLRQFFEENVVHRPITFWPDGYNTAFQYTTATDNTWVHHDSTMWAGVLYLTPNPPKGYGTTLYCNKQSGVYEHMDGLYDYNDSSEISGDLSLWHKEIEVENRYNRLIVYNGMIYHRSTTAGFGENQHDGRLFQTFFFDTE